jgi:hypothetical protein
VVARPKSGDSPDFGSPRSAAKPSGVFITSFIVATINQDSSLETRNSCCYDKFMEDKRERGRPPKPDEERRDAELRIRLTEQERWVLDRAAGEQTSTWAREVLLKAATRKSR